jgi:CorA-like Mg2+ transporter protein
MSEYYSHPDDASNSLAPHHGPDSLSRYYSGQRRYSDAVKAQSRRVKHTHLICGSHYDALANFLDNDHDFSQSHDRTSFPHVVVRTITKDRLESATYDSRSDASDFSLVPAEHDKAHLLFVRGYTSPLWLNRICEQTNVHPEFFRRHLRFIDKNEFFDLPSLPSGNRDILRLRVTTICHRSVPLTYEEIIKSQKQEEECIVKHQRALSVSGRAGDSIIRRYAVHNESTFTLGQEFSCFIKPGKHSWTGIIWLDMGRDLYEQSPGEWFGKSAQGLAGNHVCLPVIKHPQKLADLDTPARDNGSLDTLLDPRLGQNTGLLPLQYGASLDRPTMLEDAMYALSDLVAFAASSEKQFLNMIGAQIDRDLRLYQDMMEMSLMSISHCKVLLDEHLNSTLETLACLRSRGGANWPHTSSDRIRALRKNAQTIDNTISDLIVDYEALVDETKFLVRRCIQGSEIITSRALLQESKRAAEQNDRIGRLTKLAFFFVPTSFVGSFFGMNFKQFGQGELHLWIGVVVMVIFVIGAAAVCYSDEATRRWKQVARHLGASSVT